MIKRQDPSIVVGAFIFNDKGELFLTKSDRWDDKYVMPGGHVEYGETVNEALKREMKEETNLDIGEIEFLGFKELLNLEQDFYKDRHMISLNFKCKALNNEVILTDEAQEYIWISMDKVLELDLFDAVREEIKKHFIKK